MPRFDKTGPEGEGPMTGRRMGKCTNYGGRGAPEENDSASMATGRQGLGRGLGRGLRGTPGRGPGRGLGRGLQNRFRGGDK